MTIACWPLLTHVAYSCACLCSVEVIGVPNRSRFSAELWQRQQLFHSSAVLDERIWRAAPDEDPAGPLSIFLRTFDTALAQPLPLHDEKDTEHSATLSEWSDLPDIADLRIIAGQHAGLHGPFSHMSEGSTIPTLDIVVPVGVAECTVSWTSWTMLVADSESAVTALDSPPPEHLLAMARHESGSRVGQLTVTEFIDHGCGILTSFFHTPCLCLTPRLIQDCGAEIALALCARSCTTRHQECGVDDVDLPPDGSDCAAGDLTDTPVAVVAFSPAGTCFTPGTDPSGKIFPQTTLNAALVSDGFTLNSMKLSCADTTAHLIYYSDGACTAGQEISGAALDRAIETNMPDLSTADFGGSLTVSVVQHEITESMAVVDSPICNPIMTMNCDTVRAFRLRKQTLVVASHFVPALARLGWRNIWLRRGCLTTTPRQQGQLRHAPR